MRYAGSGRIDGPCQRHVYGTTVNKKKKGLEVLASKPLNFFVVIGAPGRIRTHDPLARSLAVTLNMLFLLTILPTAVRCFISVQDSSVLCKSLQSPFTGTSGASSTIHQTFAKRRRASEACLH